MANSSTIFVKIIVALIGIGLVIAGLTFDWIGAQLGMRIVKGIGMKQMAMILVGVGFLIGTFMWRPQVKS